MSEQTGTSGQTGATTRTTATATGAGGGSARRRRAGRWVAGGLVAALLAGGGYVAAAALTPLPALRTTLDVETERYLDADATGAEAAVAAQTLPTAIGWADGEAVWSNDDAAYSLGSISKLITMLVVLEAEPLEPGTDGPIHVWTEADAARQEEYLAAEGVAYPIPVGTEITARQMLQLIFLPSANDYAAAYAYRVFGDDATFLAAVEEWRTAHGLDSLSFVEPTGMDEGDAMNAADLVRVARLALQNPTIAELNATQRAELPWGIGTVENSNPLLGVLPGVIGTKTGTLSNVGYNLIVSQEADAFGREIVRIAVTLARPSKEARAESGAEMLAAMAPLAQQLPLVAAGDRLGTVRTWQGEEVGLVAADSTSAVLLPGEGARLTAELDAVGPGVTGSPAGELRIETANGPASVAIVTDAAIAEPDLLWRLAHPAVVFGWAEPGVG